MAGTERRDLRFARIWNPSLLKMNFALYTNKRNAIARGISRDLCVTMAMQQAYFFPGAATAKIRYGPAQDCISARLV
jgi:hypothetical protein